MKIRQAKKIFKSRNDYWWSRRFWYKLEFDQLHSKDHRITKAISLIKKKQCMTFLNITVSEKVFDEILKGMKANGLVSISQYNDIYSNNTIYEGACEIYKNK